jgi:hypothetical protein
MAGWASRRLTPEVPSGKNLQRTPKSLTPEVPSPVFCTSNPCQVRTPAPCQARTPAECVYFQPCHVVINEAQRGIFPVPTMAAAREIPRLRLLCMPPLCSGVGMAWRWPGGGGGSSLRHRNDGVGPEAARRYPGSGGGDPFPRIRIIAPNSWESGVPVTPCLR